jgi:UDP-N-acetylmuramate dehydrogenase
VTALEGLARTVEKAGELRRDEPMSRHTTFGVGGPTDLYLRVRSVESLELAYKSAKDAEIPVFILGSGSNIVVADSGIRGLVIDNRAKSEVRDDAGYVHRIASGASFAAYARRMCREGLGGISWAAGIPGTFGGAVIYNAGAYGGCLADIVTRVRLQDSSGDTDWLPAGELELVYRGSAFKTGPFSDRAVLEVEIELQTGDVDALRDELARHDQKRLAAQPRGRNAGSMFKNPPDQPAWKLIEAVGLRGATEGGAGISDKHANFFVNTGGARASEVRTLVEETERRVRDQFDIELQREVSFVGDWS